MTETGVVDDFADDYDELYGTSPPAKTKESAAQSLKEDQREDATQGDPPQELTEPTRPLPGVSLPLSAAENGDQHPTIHPPLQSEPKIRSQDPTIIETRAPTDVITDESRPDAVEALAEPAIDGDFVEAGQANKDDLRAEWQLDSSDEGSSDTDSDSDSDSSSDSDSDKADDDYEMLDPATAAKMLMAEEGGDDEDGPSGKPLGNAGLRTKNEQPPEVVPKPDISITEAMHVVPLGAVEHIVENFAVIKGHTSGEYQVLEQGSVLCLENRTIIGVVAETLGRVQDPMYAVAFTDQAEIDALGIARGAQVCYVQEHASFVFTQPLKGMKWTDASNIHDEEIGEDEMEFSDDEAEQEYKRAQKLARRGGGRMQTRDGDGGQYVHHAANSDRRIISYDDDQDDGQGSADPPPATNGAFQSPSESRTRRAGFDRGRGRAGRGRGGQGRGDYRGRGGRGGHNRYEDNARADTSRSTRDDQGWRQPTNTFQPTYGSGNHVPSPQPLLQAPVPPPGGAQQSGSILPPGPLHNQYQPPMPPNWMQGFQQPPAQQPNNMYGQHAGPPVLQGQPTHWSHASPPPLFPPPPPLPQQGQQQYQWPPPPVAPQMHHYPGAGQPDAYQAALQQVEILRRLNGGGQ